MTSQSVTFTESVDVSDVATGHRSSARSFTDAVGITDSRTRVLVLVRTFTETLGITDSLVAVKHHAVGVTDTVGITDVMTTHVRALAIFSPNIVGLSSVVSVVRTGVPLDTWRPVIRPDNHLVLACRTPLGEHDSPTGLTHMRLFSFTNLGDNERVEVDIATGIPAAGSWTAFGHPEWAPDGNTIVLASETSTECMISVLDSSGFGWS